MARGHESAHCTRCPSTGPSPTAHAPVAPHAPTLCRRHVKGSRPATILLRRVTSAKRGWRVESTRQWLGVRSISRRTQMGQRGSSTPQSIKRPRYALTHFHPRTSSSCESHQGEKSICEMSLATEAQGKRECGDEWSEDQRRWDAKEKGYKTEALTCRFGGDCRQGLNCPYRHSQEEIQIFVDERDLRRRKLMVRCGFCVRGECKFEGCCARTIRAATAAKDRKKTSVRHVIVSSGWQGKMRLAQVGRDQGEVLRHATTEPTTSKQKKGDVVSPPLL